MFSCEFCEIFKNISEQLFLTIVVLPCGNLNKARHMLQSQQITYSLKFSSHIGVNDNDKEHPEDIAYNLKRLAKEYKGNFRFEVYIRHYAKEGPESPKC